MVTHIDKVKARLTAPKVYQALRSSGVQVTKHVAELIMNIFGEYRANSSVAHLGYDELTKILRVWDLGVGMKDVADLCQLGSSGASGSNTAKFPTDAGYYGFGGTIATFSLGKSFHIWTLRNGRVQHIFVPARDWEDASKFTAWDVAESLVDIPWEVATESNTPKELLEGGHGTFLEIQMVPNEHTFDSAQSIPVLEESFAPALCHGKQIIFHHTVSRKGGTHTSIRKLKAPVMPYVAPENQVVYDFDVIDPDTGSILPVKGSASYDSNRTEGNNQRMNIWFGDTVVKTTLDCYSRGDTFRGSGVFGITELGSAWLPYLTTNKDGIKYNGVWNLLMDGIYWKIKSLLDKAASQKKNLFLESCRMRISFSDFQVGKLVEKEVVVNPRGENTNPPSKEAPSKKDVVNPQLAEEAGPEERHKVRRKVHEGCDIHIVEDALGDAGLTMVEPQNGGYYVAVNTDEPSIQRALAEGSRLNPKGNFTQVQIQNQRLAVDYIRTVALQDISTVIVEDENEERRDRRYEDLFSKKEDRISFLRKTPIGKIRFLTAFFLKQQS